MSSKKVLKLNALRNPVAGQIELADGSVHDVLTMDFGTHHSLESADAKDSVSAVREAVRKVVPSLTDQEVDALQIEEGQAIMTLSGAGIEAVEKMFPNAVRPEGQTSPA